MSRFGEMYDSLVSGPGQPAQKARKERKVSVLFKRSEEPKVGRHRSFAS